MHAHIIAGSPVKAIVVVWFEELLSGDLIAYPISDEPMLIAIFSNDRSIQSNHLDIDDAWISGRNMESFTNTYKIIMFLAMMRSFII